MEAKSELIAQFNEFTGNTNEEVARNTLEACDGNLEQAIGLFFASDGATGSNSQQNQPVVVDGGDSDVEILDDAVETGAQNRPNAMDDQNGPIVLDDSDPEEDGVRRPMRPVRERLVGQSYHQYYNEARRNRTNDIFEQFHDYTSGPSTRTRRARQNASSTTNPEDRKPGLKELFRPPIDIIARHDWDSLLQVAQDENRWVLVNIQDPSEFACQTLNRDCWSNAELKEFIKATFLFWQVYQNSPDGRRVAGYYAVNQFPSIFIVDPRTGECVHKIKTRNASEMIADLSQFRESFSTFADYDKEVRIKYNSHPKC